MEKELEYAKENAALQKQILDELQKLKESPLKGIDTMDNDALREERDRLLDENAKMRVNGGGSSNNDGDGGSSTVRYLRSKVSVSALILVQAIHSSIHVSSLKETIC